MLQSDNRTRALIAGILIGSAALIAYGGAYGWARAAHLLVRESPLCDPDRIVPGAGTPRAVRWVFAPLIALEDGYWLARSL